MTDFTGDLPRDKEEGDESLRYIGDMKFRYENEKLVRRMWVNPPEVAASAEVRDERKDLVVIEVESSEGSDIEDISNPTKKLDEQVKMDDFGSSGAVPGMEVDGDVNVGGRAPDSPQGFEATIDLEEGHGVSVVSEVSTENDVLEFITDTLTRYGHTDYGFDGHVEYLAKKQFAKIIDDIDPEEVKKSANID